MLKFIVLSRINLDIELNWTKNVCMSIEISKNCTFFFIIVKCEKCWNLFSRLLSLLFLLMLILSFIQNHGIEWIQCNPFGLSSTVVAQNKGNDTSSIVWRDLFYLFFFSSSLCLKHTLKTRSVYRVYVSDIKPFASHYKYEKYF